MLPARTAEQVASCACFKWAVQVAGLVTIAWVEWQVICPVTRELGLVTDALGWLGGPTSEVIIDETRSWHGAPLRVARVRLDQRGQAGRSVARLGSELLAELLEGGGRMDEDGVLHVRLDLAALADGALALCAPGTRGEVVKGRLRAHAYGGMTADEAIRGVLEEARERALRTEATATTASEMDDPTTASS